MTDPLCALARDGVLRAAINTGNRALVQMVDGVPQGLSPALAERLAGRIGASLSPVIYDGAGKVFDDAGTGAWDVAFLAVDPKRAEKVSFTRPYHGIEATYAIRRGGPVTEVAQADAPGVTVLTSVGSAYDLYLAKHLRHATHDRTGTPAESFAAFREGRGDVVAGVRQSLERFFAADPDIVILPGVLTRVEQAMVLPGATHPLTAALDAFVAEALAEGFVAART